jgi:hypothetical protein
LFEEQHDFPMAHLEDSNDEKGNHGDDVSRSNMMVRVKLAMRLPSATKSHPLEQQCIDGVVVFVRHGESSSPGSIDSSLSLLHFPNLFCVSFRVLMIV